MAEYIRRYEAMKLCMKYSERCFESNDAKGQDVADNLLSDVCRIPTADVAEVKHGEWEVNVGMNYNKERICPICKKKIESNYWNNCPNCGAKMDGKGD